MEVKEIIPEVLINDLPIPVIWVNRNGNFELFNNAFQKVFLKETDSEISHLSKILSKNSLEKFIEFTQSKSDRLFFNDYVSISELKYYAHIHLFKNESFNNFLIHFHFSDLGILSHSEHLLKVLDSLPEVLFSFDPISRKTTFSTSGVETLCGFSLEDFKENPGLWPTLIINEDKELVENAIINLENSEKIDLQYRIKNKNGELIWIGAKIWKVYDDEGKYYRAYGCNKNITQQKIEEEKSKEVKLLFELFLDQYPESAVFIFDKDLKYQLVGGEELSKAGYDKNLLIGKTPYQILQKDRWEELKKYYEGAINGETYQFRHESDGKYYQLYFSPLMHENGLVKYGLIVSFNIEKIVSLERESIKNLNYFKTIVEIAEAGIWEIDTNGYSLFVNDHICNLLGYNSEELLNKPAPAFFSKGLGIKSYRDFRETLNGNRSHVELELLKKDGTPVWVSISAKPLRDENKNVKSIFGVITDITSRIKNEESLRASEELFFNAFNYSGIGIALVGESGNWLKVNPALCKIIGYSKDELFKLTWQDITHPEDLDLDSKLAAQLFSGDIPSYEIEKRYYKKDGSIVWVLLTGSLVKDKSGKVLYAIAQLQDITSRKAAEQKLVSIINQKDRITAAVAHDLRNPISSIVSLNQMYSSAENEDEREEISGLINEACYKSLDIIKDLLEISQLEDESFKLDSLKLDIVDLIQKSIRILDSAIEKKNISIDLQHPENRIICDVNPQKMSRVFDNLLSNAIKFSRENAKISIRVYSNKEHKIIIEIEDYGIGIPKNLQAVIFDKFSKARRIGLGGETSTGLGMSIVKQIVELHKGKISLKSTEGKGTCFTIELPKL